MAFNGSGLFQRLYNWVNDKNLLIPITASRMDDEMNGMATGLSTCLTKDGQTLPSNNLPMNGFKHTNAAAGSSSTDYATLGQTQGSAALWGGSAGGTANAITFSLIPAVASVGAGQRFQLLATAANTGATTVNYGGGVKNLLKRDLLSLAANDIKVGDLIDIEYDGTQCILMGARTYAHGADIVASATLNLDAATGDYVFVTGNTGITAITLAEGRECTTRFTGTPAITNGASLITPTAANFTCTAGDIIVWRGEASGVVRAVGCKSAGGLSNSMLAQMAAATIKLRAAGAGTGDAIDGTAAQLNAILNSVLTVKIQVKTANGTYTPDTGMVHCIAAGFGGGGGGGGAAATSGNLGSGGASGAFGLRVLTAAQIGASQSVAIGAAGAAGASGGGTGGTGGDTTLGALLTCKGGLGGITSSLDHGAIGGLGQTSTSGDINGTGVNGGNAVGTGNNNYGIGGTGGATFLGGAGVSTVGPTATAGTAATVNTGSGGGGANAGSGSAVAGGAGGTGILFIIQFCTQ